MRGKKRKPLRIGVIAAAGKGTRAYPRTTYIPKPLFRFGEKSLLERNAEILFKSLGVKKLYIIVGHLGEQVQEEAERIRRKYKNLAVETSPWTRTGLAGDIAVLRDRIDEDFAVILGDEFYHKTRHDRLLQSWKSHPDAEGLIAVWKSDLISNIRKNYSVELDGERIRCLIEKPEAPPNNLAGLGTYIFSSSFFDFFDSTPPSRKSGVVELTDVIDRMARETSSVYAKEVGGRYFNINSLADYYASYYELRNENFKSYKISLIIPALNNAQTLSDVISDYRSRVDEIIVVDLGSSDDTVKIALSLKAKVIRHEFDSRYGPYNARAVYEAMREARGDILVLTLADGSFRAHDMPKLLEYLKDCDMAVGTRTTRQMIEQGSNLKPLYRWLNVFFGKLVEVMWWGQEPRFTDIGCVYRALWKDSFLKMSRDIRARDKTFSLELMIESLRYHMRCIEIPVSFNQRYGYVEDERLGKRWRYFFSVLSMIFTRRLFSSDRADPSEGAGST